MYLVYLDNAVLVKTLVLDKHCYLLIGLVNYPIGSERAENL